MQATKTVDTKALDLVNGTRLNTYWKDTEKVKAFRSGVCIGTTAITDHSGGNILQGYDVTYPRGIRHGYLGWYDWLLLT